MAVFSGPKIPTISDSIIHLDSSNDKSNNQISKIWTSLVGGYSANVAPVSYSNGYFLPINDSVIVDGLSVSSNSAMTFTTVVSPTENSQGTIFAVSSGNHGLYQALSPAQYESLDNDIGASASIARTIDYNTTTQMAQYESLDNDIGASASIARTIDYNTTAQMVEYSSTDYEINSPTSITRTIDYNTTMQSAQYDSTDYEINSNLITNHIDYTENNISLHIQNGILRVRFKKQDSMIDLLENFIYSNQDIITVICKLQSNTYILSLYLNGKLLNSASVPAYGNTLPTGNIFLFSNANLAKYTNTPIRIFNIYDRALSDNEILNFSAAFKPAQ